MTSRLLVAVVFVASFGCKSEKQKCLDGKFDEFIEVCEKVCAEDDADACEHAGYLQMTYMHNKEAKKAYAKACKLGKKEACEMIGK
jgi:hypothetical protein